MKWPKKQKEIYLFLILINLFNSNFIENSNAYDNSPIFSLNDFYLNYIVYPNMLTYNGTTTYSDFENKSVNLENLGLFLNFNKSTETLYKCHVKYNFYNYSFEGDLDFNTVEYTFNHPNDLNKKIHTPFFNPPNIKKLEHFPLMTFSRDEPSILYFEGSDDYENPDWNNYHIHIPDQQGVYLYTLRPKYPGTLDPAGSYEYEYDSHFLVAGGFLYDSLPLFLELSNPEILNLTVDADPCFLRETNLPLKEYKGVESQIEGNLDIIIIFIIIGIAGISSFLFMRQRKKMAKKSWKKRNKKF